MHIAVTGPIATEDVVSESSARGQLPRGYAGAPFMGTLIKELLRRGHRVSAITTSSDLPAARKPTWKVAQLADFDIYYCPMRPHAFRPSYGRAGRAVDFFAYERKCITGALLAAAPDVVHAHWTYEFGLAAIHSGIPHVITCHDSPDAVLRLTPSLYRLARYWMARRCLTKATRLTAVSPYLAESLQRYCREPISVVASPIPREIFLLGCEVSGKDKSGTKVAMVANGWNGIKNPEPAMRAFHQLRTSSNPDIELHMFGTDFAEGEIASTWALKHGLSTGMKFRGRLPHPRLMEELSGMDVLIHPSREESCGMSVAEAMALGVPVIGGRDSGGVPWVIGNAGLAVDVESIPQIASSLQQLLDSRTQREKYGQLGRERSRTMFDPEEVLRQYEEEYQRALKSKSPNSWN